MADAFAGLRLHVHAIGGDAEQFRELEFDRRFHRPEFRLLGEDRDIDIDGSPAETVQAFERLNEEEPRVGILPARVGVRIKVADVAEAGGPEQRIRDRVQYGIGIGVADEALGVFDPHAPEDQRAAFGQPMRIVPAAHPKCHCATPYEPGNLP